MSERPHQTKPRLVVVTGSGRSGTSTVTGALARLGLHLPGPLAPADERNPKGFYETPWVIEANRVVLESVPVRGNDARPDAAALVEESASAESAELVARVRAWLLQHVAGHAQSVVKDPQIFWLHRAWRAAADEAGIDLSFVTMLRHPVEVARSRDTAYLVDKDAEHRRIREVSNVAAWCNAAYASERAFRGHPRAFVRYDDLLADWRRALAPLEGALGVDLGAGLRSEPGPGEPHPVDDFIDVSLNRSRAGWEETSVPPALRDVAERTWRAVNGLVDAPEDPAALAELDAAREAYAGLHADAVALAADHTEAAVAAARRAQRQELQQARSRNQRLRARVEELERAAPAPGPARRLAARAARVVRPRG
ncbi:sulfotransferase family protein [Nocardioides sp. Arc9.136]|uniref:sulfotransferase family protein n=1 Tax=Nocardioides sp. Arc9.136 TaxID=2996826 RepID=UPI002665BFA0|nr:sulfotransferase [Nocardioides sp. Arc9.136]WKN49394.1 sulfotransferase [Nocardioides sp. Arc9.136]